MVITFEDADDLIRIVAANPELIARLRPLVLSEELLRMPERLAAFQATTERRLEELDRRVAEKASQSEMDRRFDAVDQRFDAVDQRFDAVDQRFDEMERRIDTNTARLSSEIADLRTSVHRIGGREANREGAQLEARYHRNFANWFSQIIEEPRLVGVGQLKLMRDGRKSGSVDTREWRDVEAGLSRGWHRSRQWRRDCPHCGSVV